jgi:uncharacterized phage-associated protein
MALVAATGFTLRGTPAAFVALLSAARAQGTVITRTKMAKLLYLADLDAVEELGRPGSGVQWRWLHYGPFSIALLTIEDDLVSDGIVERQTTENYFGSVEYRLRLVRSISVDVDGEFAAIIEKTVLNHGNLAPSTLRDMTYQTGPMQEAKREGSRGQFLDLLSGPPVPDITPVQRRFERILDQLEPQTDEGNLSDLSEEIADWAEHRARATRPLVGDDLCQRLLSAACTSSPTRRRTPSP